MAKPKPKPNKKGKGGKKGKKGKPKRKPVALDPTTQSALGLAAEARRGYGVRRRSADAAAQGSTQSLNERESKVPERYSIVENETNKANANIANTLAGLGSGADPMRAIIANEQGSGLQRSARAKAAEIADIGSSKSSVQRIRSSQHAQAGQDYQETLRTISGEVSKVGAEQAKQSQIDRNARRQARVAMRGQDKTAATAAAGQAVTTAGQKSTAATAAANRAAKGKNGGGGKPKSAGTRSAARTNLKTALSLAADWPPKSGKPLSKGGPEAQKFINEAFRVKGVPKVIGQAAAEIRLYGKVKKSTRRTMRRRYGIGGP